MGGVAGGCYFSTTVMAATSIVFDTATLVSPKVGFECVCARARRSDGLKRRELAT